MSTVFATQLTSRNAVRNSGFAPKQLQPKLLSNGASATMDKCANSRAQLDEGLELVQKTIAPLWPLKDYVAVNPFFGFADRRFLDASEMLREIHGGELLMPYAYYGAKIKDADIRMKDIELAVAACQAEYSNWYQDYSVAELLVRMNIAEQTSGDAKPGDQRKYHTVADSIDAAEHNVEYGWSDVITGEISRFCAAHYDQGQAIWSSPWKELPLFEAWRQHAMLDRRLEKLGVPGFRAFVKTLSSDPRTTILQMLQSIDIAKKHWTPFMLCQFYSISGWSSYIKYRVRESIMAGNINDDLIGLLAIRLIYDAALARTDAYTETIPLVPEIQTTSDDYANQSTGQPSTDLLDRYCLQVASEIGYRRELTAGIKIGSAESSTASIKACERKKVQMVFCIDVRSEVMRRNLESINGGIETFGFAGFFGLPIEYVPLGANNGDAQCPVLTSPKLRVNEAMSWSDDESQAIAIDNRGLIRSRRQIWKLFQSSAVSCFSFVESFGVAYLGKLISDSLGLGRSTNQARYDGVAKCHHDRLGPSLIDSDGQAMDTDQLATLAEGILKSLGLIKDFARIVVICGHASQTVNNPYRAGLDCGACGGHSGESNARFAAAILNDPAVRNRLVERGIELPDDIWFAAAVHNTTTDQIEFHDIEAMPHTHLTDYQNLQQWTKSAGKLARLERSSRLGQADESDILKKSREWSEVRPEWGLAGNAAFVVAPRSRTVSGKLQGRTFMQSYDHQSDPGYKTLEMIMTAPMVVTNWINMQYYASTVDNLRYGSGNKVLHNVVGQLGIFEGNGGDLKTGLPWQSVHDGKDYQHQPLRLSVVVEAPRSAISGIVDRHDLVRNLACNGWLNLIAIDGETMYQLTSEAKWIAMSAA